MNDKDPDIIRIHSFARDTSTEDLVKFRNNYDWKLTKQQFDFVKKQFQVKSDMDFSYKYLYLQKGGKNADNLYKDYFLLNLEGESFNPSERIKDIQDRLRNVQFTNLDAIDVIKKYDSPDTFFFVDPPYPSRERYYTICNLNWSLFYETLKNLKGKWMMVFDPYIESRIKTLPPKRRAYASECSRIALKIVDENPHIILEEEFKMKYMWKNSVGKNEGATKKYVIVTNYPIKPYQKLVETPLEW